MGQLLCHLLVPSERSLAVLLQDMDLSNFSKTEMPEVQRRVVRDSTGPVKGH